MLGKKTISGAKFFTLSAFRTKQMDTVNNAGDSAIVDRPGRLDANGNLRPISNCRYVRAKEKSEVVAVFRPSKTLKNTGSEVTLNLELSAKKKYTLDVLCAALVLVSMNL